MAHAYRYKGSAPIDKFSKAERATLSPNGGRIAYSTPELVRWSEQPFQQWHDLVLNIAPGTKVTGLAWPVDPRRSSEDLPILASLPELERIRVSTDAIPKIHFPLLAKISGLQSLELNQPPYYLQADMDFIANIQQLRNLKMKYLSDDALKRLQKLPNIESIQIESLTSLRIDTLAKVFPRLRELACDKVEAKPLADALPFLESLESLTVRSVPKKDALLLVPSSTQATAESLSPLLAHIPPNNSPKPTCQPLKLPQLGSLRSKPPLSLATAKEFFQ